MANLTGYNYGKELAQLDPRNWNYGGYTGIISEILQENGQWLDYTPCNEWQSSPYLKTMACVSFSILNTCEIIIKRKWNLSDNFSDRFLAKASGTTIYGNSFSTVLNKFHEKGVPHETEYPWDKEQVKTWEEYYKDLNDSLYAMALSFKNNYTVNYEFIYDSNPDVICEALKSSPLVVCLHAWGTKDENSIYPKTEDEPNHACVLIGYEYGKFWYIYDSFDAYVKKVAWDYIMPVKVKLNIQKTSEIKDQIMNLPNDTLVQEVEKSGTVGLILDGKKIVDDPIKVLLTYLVRTQGKALTKEQWDSFPTINIDKKPIN